MYYLLIDQPTPDPDFFQGREKLKMLSMAMVSDLQGLALDFFLASRADEREAVSAALEVIASVNAAWQLLLDELGIDPEEMAAASCPRHYAVETLLEIADGRECPKLVEVHLKAMRDCLAA